MLFFINGETDCWIESVNLNTSHVILYQIAEEWDGTKEWYLNTSHVILYHYQV